MAGFGGSGVGSGEPFDGTSPQPNTSVEEIANGIRDADRERSTDDDIDDG